MGLPQNQALGSAGQPPAQASMPQLPTGPAGFDNYFNSPQQAVSGPPNNDAVIQQMYAQQAGQAQANTQALMAPAAPQLQYAVSADDKNVLIGGKTYDIDSNPTAVWNAVNSSEGQQGASAAPPGYKLVPAKMVANYLQSVNHGMFSNAYQGAKELVTRAPGALLNTAGDAAKWAGADTVGQGLNNSGAGHTRSWGGGLVVRSVHGRCCAHVADHGGIARIARNGITTRVPNSGRCWVKPWPVWRSGRAAEKRVAYTTGGRS
jgi:hypothetical protein